MAEYHKQTLPHIKVLEYISDRGQKKIITCNTCFPQSFFFLLFLMYKYLAETKLKVPFSICRKAYKKDGVTFYTGR